MCYKNIHCWHGPYSFSFSSSPSTSTLRTIHTYTCTTSSGWSSFPISFLVIFLLIAFLLTCTISAHQISGSLPYALSTLLVHILLYLEPHTLLSVHDVVFLDSQSVDETLTKPIYLHGQQSRQIPMTDNVVVRGWFSSDT